MANIKIHLNNIKNALFGNEVRGSIHDGIDAINKEVESTTKRQVKLEETQNQLIINAGNSNAEIVDARVGENGKSYEKLGDRLDEVDSQLEQKANQLETVESLELLNNIKVNRTEISENMTFKGTKTTNEIMQIVGTNGDYYYSSDEKCYYMYSDKWDIVGSGSSIDRMLITQNLVVENRYLNKQGNWSTISNNNFKSLEINVKPRERFMINSTYLDSLRMYSLVDKNDKVVSVYPNSSEDLTKTTESIMVTIPNDVEILRVGTYGAGSVVKAPIIDVDYDTVISSKNNKNLLDVLINDFKVSTEVGNYLNEKGLIREAPNNNFEITEIDVKKGDVFFISGQYIDKSRLFSLKNINNEVVCVYPNSSEDLTITAESNIPLTIECDGVLTVCNYKLSDINLSIKKLTFTTNDGENTNSKDGNSIYENNILLLNKILCIGDSLTRGAYYSPENNGASIKENYPYYLSKLSQLETTNAGHSGYSASTWYEEKRSLYDIASYDTFIIWLGTNNGYTDTLEEDTNFDSYHDYALTETGYYCKIIENIKELRPNANIFICKIFASKGDVDTSNLVLDKIALKYNLPILDMNDGTLYNKSNTELQNLLHPFGNAVHFGKIGNLTVARKISDFIDEYINNNLSQFEDIYIP